MSDTALVLSVLLCSLLAGGIVGLVKNALHHGE